jgi:hypothetical protein
MYLPAQKTEKNQLRATGASGVDIDRIDWTDIDTKHTVDTLILFRRVRLDFAFGMIRRIDPLEDIHRAVLETCPVSDTDIKINRDVGTTDAEFFWRVGRTPDIDIVFLTLQFSVLLEVRIDSHWCLSTWGLRT